MKSFVGNVFFTFFISFFINCTQSNDEVVKNIKQLESIKDKVLRDKNQNFDKEYVKHILNDKELELLGNLNFNIVRKYDSVIVFEFKNKYDKNWLDKKFNNNVNGCNVFLFYGKNREKIINYEQYAECRIKKENIDDNWTYVYQEWYCAD